MGNYQNQLFKNKLSVCFVLSHISLLFIWVPCHLPYFLLCLTINMKLYYSFNEAHLRKVLNVLDSKQFAKSQHRFKQSNTTFLSIGVHAYTPFTLRFANQLFLGNDYKYVWSDNNQFCSRWGCNYIETVTVAQLWNNMTVQEQLLIDIDHILHLFGCRKDFENSQRYWTPAV